MLLINPMLSERSLFFPLGLGYIARVLLDNGHSVEVMDINAHKMGMDEVQTRLMGLDFDAVGITALITQYPIIKTLVRVIKQIKPSARIIVGGGLASSIPVMLLNDTEADIAVVGEGEETARELFDALDGKGALSSVDGLWYKTEGGLLKTKSRGYIADLDTIHFPAYHLFPMDIYTDNKALALRATFDGGIRTMNMISSRGCPYSCRYCFHGVYGKRFRARSPENITAEIKMLRDAYGVKGIMFDDDTFVVNRERVFAFCDSLIAEGVDLAWACNGRANLMDGEMLERMKSSGCRVLSYGIESGSQKILDILRRQTTVEQGQRAVQLTWEKGMIPYAYLMIGSPEETSRTIKETISFCLRNKVGQGFGFVTLFPNTPLWKWAVETGKITVKDYDRLVKEGRLTPSEITVNLTDIPDWELIKWRDRAEQIIVGQTFIQRTFMIMKRVGLWTALKNIKQISKTTIFRKGLGWFVSFAKRRGSDNGLAHTKIVVITRIDPVSIPVYLNDFMERWGNSVSAIVTIGDNPRLTNFALLRERLNTLGLRDTVLRSIRLFLFTLFGWLNRYVRVGKFYSVQAMAEHYEVPIYHFNSVRDGKLLALVREMSPDIITSVACPKIFPKEILDIPRMGGVNIHHSLLPRGKGRDPAFWAMLLGQDETGITIHYMDEGIDSGDIIVQESIPILPRDTLASLYYRIVKRSSSLLADAVDMMVGDRVTRMPNDGAKATYYGIPTKEDIMMFKAKGKRLTSFRDCIPILRERGN